MLNKVELIGRLGKDPEVRTFDNEKKVVNFSMVTSEKYKNQKGEIVEESDWHNCACWRPGLIGVIEKYVKKGSKVYVEGKSKTRSYETEHGKRYVTEVIIEKLIMLDDKKNTTQNAQESAKNGSSTPPPENDDLPF